MATESSWEGSERREFVRVDRHMNVGCQVVQTPNEPWKELGAEDISRGGLLLVGRGQLPAGTEVKMTLESAAEGISLKLDGVVRRCHRLTAPGEARYELGIEFFNVDDDQREGIMQIISTPPGKERRRYVRLRRAFAMRFKTGLLSGWQSATAHDICAGGLMFTLRDPLKTGTRLKIDLELAPKNEVKVDGRVAAVDPGNKVRPARIHVAFHDPKGKARKQIGRFISEALQPDDAGHGA